MNATEAMVTLATLRGETNTAIAGSDWTTAEIKILQARAIIASLPDTDHLGLGHNWRDDFDRLYEDVQTKKSEAMTAISGGIQRANVEYVSAS